VKRTKHIVLDTSIFVNPDSRFLFGNTPGEAFEAFLDMLKNKKDLICYMPPSIYEELSKFIEKMPSAKKVILINKKPPSSYESKIPSMFVYEFIEEMRLRINKGLRIAEKYSRKSIQITDPPKTKHDQDEALIKTLRQEYRDALRVGVLDSKQDFDLILLAKELNAYLATTDGGLIHWAQKLGICCISPQELKEMIS
jgi:RNA-free ribonuclease P